MACDPLLLVLLLVFISGARCRLLDLIQAHSVGVECRQQASAILNQNLSYKFREASASFPEELFGGRLYSLGKYDKCISMQLPEEDSVMESKYCLVSVTAVRLKPLNSTSPDVTHLFQHEHDGLRLRRNRLRWGLCVPRDCGGEDLRLALEGSPVLEQLGIALQVSWPEHSCQSLRDEQAKARGFKESRAVALGACSIILVILTVLSTLHDWRSSAKDVARCELPSAGAQKPGFETAQGSWRRLATAFSLRVHWHKLSACSTTRHLDAVHGIKALTMAGVILGHTSWAYTGGPIDNPEWIEKQYGNIAGPIIYNGHSVVQSFFAMTGLLEALSILTIYDKVPFSIALLFKLYVNRILRILPAYFFVVWFNSYIMYNLGSGPLWAPDMTPIVEDCQRNWWTDLLFINNYLNPGATCMYHTWYLALDVQMYILTPIVMYIAHVHPRISRCLLLVFLTAIVGAGFSFSLANGLEPVPLITPEVNRGVNTFSNRTFQQFYITVFNNGGSYIIGLVTGQILYRIQNKEIGLSDLAIVCSGYVFYQPSYVYSELEAASYAALHGALFGLCSSWVALASAMQEGGFIRHLLGSRVFQTLGRLSFAVYLVHPTVVYITSRSVRSPVNVTVFGSTAYTSLVYTYSYIWAAVLYCFVESPLANVQRIYLLKQRR